MERVTAKTNLKAQDFGVEVVDVRINGLTSSQNEEAVFSECKPKENSRPSSTSEGEEEATKVQAAPIGKRP